MSSNRADTISDKTHINSVSNYVYVDVLRGVAILGVLLVHITQQGMESVGLDKLPMHIEYLLWAGRHGVTLFFVVSAFTLMRSLHIRRGNESKPILKYFARRFFRIAPVYYLILIATFFLYGKSLVPSYTNSQNAILAWTDLAAHMLFVNGFFPWYSNSFLGVEWSVSTEFIFYMLLPLLFLWLNKRSDPNRAIIKIGLAYLTSIVILFCWRSVSKNGHLQLLGDDFVSPVAAAWSHFFILTHLPAFFAGVAVWVKLQQKILINTQTNKQTNKGLLL